MVVLRRPRALTPDKCMLGRGLRAHDRNCKCDDSPAYHGEHKANKNSHRKRLIPLWMFFLDGKWLWMTVENWVTLSGFVS